MGPLVDFQLQLRLIYVHVQFFTIRLTHLRRPMYSLKMEEYVKSNIIDDWKTFEDVVDVV